MSSKRPDDYVDPTAMARRVSKPAGTERNHTATADTTVRAAASAEQDLGRAEKIHPHPSSHRAAGTVAPDA